MNVLTLDPGQTTGWSFWAQGKLVRWGICENLYQLMGLLNDCSHVDVIVVENFVSRATMAEEKLTVRRIGAIEGFACINDIPLWLQDPNVRKAYIQFIPELVTKMGYVTRNIRIHSRDAIAHGIRYHCKEVPGWQSQYLDSSHLKTDA